MKNCGFDDKIFVILPSWEKMITKVRIIVQYKL